MRSSIAVAAGGGDGGNGEIRLFDTSKSGHLNANSLFRTLINILLSLPFSLFNSFFFFFFQFQATSLNQVQWLPHFQFQASCLVSVLL